jgi:hypothetical protein
MADEQRTVKTVYREMESVNFSCGILEKNPWDILLIPMKGILWSDWGSEGRILETLAKIGRKIRGMIPMVDARRGWRSSHFGFPMPSLGLSASNIEKEVRQFSI